MDFSELQQSWQQQVAPPAATTREASASSLLAETERLHRFGRRRNWLATGLLGLALACFLAGQLLREGSHTPLQLLGLAILTTTLLGFLGLMWWGTALRAAARPDLDSRAYLRASLRAFRFRRQALLWLGIPYALGFGVGMMLWNLPRLGLAGPADWWKAALALAVLMGAALVGHRVGLRKYEQQFGPTEQALAQWQHELFAES